MTTATRRSGLRRTAGNAGWSLAAEALRLVTATLVFLVLTRRFPPERYGVLVGVLALLTFLLPQATVGSSYLLLQRVAGQGWDPVVAVRRSLGAVVGGGAAVTLVLLAVRPFVLPQVSAATMALLGVSELVLGGALEAVVFLAQAQERLRAMAAARAAFGVARLLAATVLFAAWSRPALWHWAALAVGAGALGVVTAQRVVIGRLVLPVRPRRDDWREGWPFSLGFSADKLRDSADSVLLIRLDRPLDAGVYGAGVRMVAMATTPVFSLVHALNARFFRDGHSPAEARRLAVKASATGLLFALPLGGVLLVAGDRIARVLPSEYAETGPVLRYLAAIPALIVVEVFPAMALTAIGHHRTRMGFNLLTAAVNVVLDIWWIPDHGWRGAIVATVLSAAAYVVVLWTALELAVRRHRAVEAAA